MIDTKNLYPTTQGKIIQLDYDFITSLEGACCYCLTDAQVQMILTITDYYGWSTRWFSNDGTIDQQTITDLKGGLVEALMNGCCGDDLSVFTRYTPDGHYQTSTDGGATWNDSPMSDPRNAVPQFPPFVPDGTIDEKCTYADSIVQQLKTGIVDKLTDGMTYVQILEVIEGALFVILAALAPTVIGTIIVTIMGAIIAAIIGETIPVFQAAMTNDVYDRFRCNIAGHIEDDGSFTQDDVDAIYAQLAVDESGIALIFLQQLVALMGIHGMTNAARSGFGSPTAECCVTGCDISSWDVFPDRGTITSRTTFTVFIDATILPADGKYWASIGAPDIAHCCDIGAQADNSGQIYVVSGSPDASFYSPCGNLPSDFSGWLGLAFGSTSMNGVSYRSNTPFTLAIDTTRT